MGTKIAARLAERGHHVTAAANEHHHLRLGPGAALESTWIDAGLALPDIARMRAYRLDRVVAQLDDTRPATPGSAPTAP